MRKKDFEIKKEWLLDNFRRNKTVILPIIRVSKFAVENVFNSNATIVVLNSTKTTAINDNEKNLAKNEEKLTIEK